MRKVYYILLPLLLLCIGCEWKWRSAADEPAIQVERYDRLQSLYLTTGDFSALQQMNITYPLQTRTLIEEVLRIGQVDDPEISQKFLAFFQDSTLQQLINESEQQYANMDDINEQFTDAFRRLVKMLPEVEVPEIYAQIGSLDQSVIVGNNTLGISLDKYLGADYPLYLRPDYGYSDRQRQMMTRRYIVPDCMGFYLLSLFPMPTDHELTQFERDMHVGKIQWTVNRLLNTMIFNTLYVRMVDRYVKKKHITDVGQMLRDNDYNHFR